MKRSFSIACLSIAATAISWPAFADGASKPPALAPLPSVLAPPDNLTTPAKAELGKLLFWDGRLSGNGQMACVACHQPGLGWGTGAAISLGYPGTVHWRNSQTILNSAYYNKLVWDGSATGLEAQAPAAAGGAVAGNGDDAMMEMRLAFVPEYRKAFKEVFGTDWPLLNDAWKGIAAFHRTGVPTAPDFATSDVEQITFRWEVYQKGVPEKIYRAAKDDHGLYYVTLRPDDIGKWRTPSLRELKYTGPYMHNGVFETLEEVVDFYDRGGGEGSVLKPLGLAADEKKALVAFLDSLSMDQPVTIPDPKIPETKPLWTEK